MGLLISKEMEKRLLDKKLKDIKFGCGNITLIFDDNTKLYISLNQQKQLEIELEYFKKEQLSQILE